MPPFIRSCFFTTTTTTTTPPHHPLFLSLCHRINFVFRDLIRSPRNCNVARSVCLHNFSFYIVVSLDCHRLPIHPLSLSLSPAFRIRAPPSVHLFFLFSKYRTHASKRVAAYFDFVSSNHDRESGFSFLFLFFFPSQLFESSRVLSSPNPNPSSIPRWELYLHSLTTWRGSRVDLFLIPFPFLKWSMTIASSHFPFSFRNPFHDLLSDLSLRRECYREKKKKRKTYASSLCALSSFFFFYFSVNPPSPPLSNQVVAVVVVRQPS